MQLLVFLFCCFSTSGFSEANPENSPIDAKKEEQVIPQNPSIPNKNPTESVLNATMRPTENYTAEPFPVFDSTSHGKGGSFFFVPTLSYLFPSFGQWYYGQYEDALLMTGTTFASLNLISSSNLDNEQVNALIQESIDQGRNPFVSHNKSFQKYLLGAKLYNTVSSVSAYQSFRTGVRAYPRYDDFSFLTHEESVGDLIRAPLEFKFLYRTSTQVTLGLATLGLLALKSNPVVTPETLGYSAAVSLMAGVSEEALYRGWIMPVAMHFSKNATIANGIQALLFYYAHAPAHPTHLVMGYWLGYLTQQNNWTLSEAVFIHTWWDVLAFTASLVTHPENPTKLQIDLPTFYF